MKIPLALIFILFVSSPLFSQYSENFEHLTKNLNPIDTLNFTEHYKNGQIREKGTVLTYQVGDNIEETYFGEYYQYFRNGRVRMKAEFDRFGNLLTQECYYNFGGLSSESRTLEIDSKAKDLAELFRTDENVRIVSHDKFYSYSIKLDSMYLKKEGKMIGDKKIGVWKIYSRDGKLIDQKQY